MLLGKLTTAPTIEPVTLVQAQTHLILTGQDDYINSLIKTSRITAERYLNRSLILQTWTAYSDGWCREFVLPNSPILAVTHVKYYNESGTLVTLEASNYWVSNKKDPGSVRFRHEFSPPSLEIGRPNAIEIEYTAGYLATGTDTEKQTAVPEPIKHGMKILMTDLHEHRGQYVVGNNTNTIPGLVANLLHPYRLYNF